MDNIKVSIKGTLIGKFEKVVKELPFAEKRALISAAYFLRDKIKQQLTSSLPKATVHNPKYNDTLADAVMFSKIDGASLTVHAMGTRRSGSGTYRTRFFENDTRDRYQKTWNGQKLKKKRFLGHITGTHFFATAVEANRSETEQKIIDVLEKYVQQTING